MLGNLAGRLLGLVREQATAWLFGATGETDAFVAASAVPTVVYDFLVVGAVSAALVPTFVQSVEDRARLWRVASTVLNLAALALLAATALLGLLAVPLIGALGAGFADWQKSLAVDMLRIMLVALVFRGLAGVFTAALYAQGRFIRPALAPTGFNLGIILLLLTLHQALGVAALAAGVLLGSLLQLALQLSGLRDFRYRPSFDFRSPEVRGLLRLYGPVVAGIVVAFVGIGLDRYLASQLQPGSMSVMAYANRLIQLPLGLVSSAVAIAVLPVLARQSGTASAPRAYSETLQFGLRIVLLLTVPAMVGLGVLIEPLVRLLFEHGAFTAYDTERTAAVFLFYAPQLPFTAAEQVLIYAFYARRDPKTPALVAVAGLVCYLALALPTLGSLGAGGLALANTTQHTASALLLLALIQRTSGRLGLSSLLGFGARLLVSAGVMALAIWLVLALVGARLGGSLPGLALLLFCATGTGLGVFLATSLALRIGEPRQLWALAAESFGRPAAGSD